jgi:hypothetical protein
MAAAGWPATLGTHPRHDAAAFFSVRLMGGQRRAGADAKAGTVYDYLEYGFRLETNAAVRIAHRDDVVTDASDC